MTGKKGRPTIADVAKSAGVAKSTVSRIINNVPGVKPATRNKVSQAIRALGYTPNIMARSLRTNLRQQIALAIDDIRNPYYPELAWAAEEVARRNGFRLVLINHYGNPSEELAAIKDVNEICVDGIVLLSISHPKTLSSVIKKAEVPVCLIGNYDNEMPADVVGLTKSEGNLAMEHLIRIGRKRIAYAGGPIDLLRSTRFAAYEQSLAANFMSFDSSLTFFGDNLSLQTGFAAAKYFNSLDEKPDAVFASNDLVAIGVIHGLIELGVRVPEEMAVIGIDDIQWCNLTTPRVSSVSTLAGEKGRIAVELLLDRIGKQAPDMFQQVNIEPRLVVRESTVKPVLT